MGNEFFARDLLEVGVSEPARFKNPPGIISFSSGAFMGYDKIFPKEDDFFVPYQFSWSEPVEPGSVPQNKTDIMPAETVFEQIGSMEGVTRYFQDTNGNSVVVAYSHYARGAYWLTWDLEAYWEFCNEFPFVRPDESEILDKTSWDKLDDYLCGKYRDYLFRRNDTPFSALTVWYIPGLDHEAHIKGMGIYNEYLTDTIDPLISKFTDRLIGLDEFDNKLFIIVSDHGMTGMPVDLKYKHRNWLGVEVEKEAYVSCKMNVKFVDPDNPKMALESQKAERSNNNLHIWELAEGLRIIGKHVGLNYKLLVPKEIAEIYGKRDEDLQFRPTADIHEANVIAALNGPMAHIYLRGGDGWQDQPSGDDILLLALMFRRLFQEDGQMLPIQVKDEVKRVFPKLLSSVDKILVRTAGGEYRVYEGYGVSPSSISAMGSGYIEAETRISGLNNLERSGDIILLMKDKTEGVEADRYTCGVACKAWHGSLNASDSYVPFILTYPGGNSEELNKFVGCETCPSYGGNWKVSDMILKIISEQYK